MSLDTLTKSTRVEIPIDEIGEHYRSLRLISPSAEIRMLRSMKRYGQLAPVVINQEADDRHELLDGFKRLRAARNLGFQSLRAWVVAVGGRAGKAALLQCNWTGKTVSDLEEALVVQSLCRQDGMSQVEVAALLDRDKSWVSRRMALIERLSEQVQEAIRLGLIGMSSGRELARLPRGNQREALAAIQKHRLTYREATGLVAALISRPRREHEAILRCEDILAQRIPPLPRRGKEAAILYRRLLAMERGCLAIIDKAQSSIAENDLSMLAPVIDRAVGAAESAIANLKQWADGPTAVF
jgi:ParB family chromosome partitioning protein